MKAYSYFKGGCIIFSILMRNRLEIERMRQKQERGYNIAFEKHKLFERNFEKIGNLLKDEKISLEQLMIGLNLLEK